MLWPVLWIFLSFQARFVSPSIWTLPALSSHELPFEKIYCEIKPNSWAYRFILTDLMPICHTAIDSKFPQKSYFSKYLTSSWNSYPLECSHRPSRDPKSGHPAIVKNHLASGNLRPILICLSKWLGRHQYHHYQHFYSF